MFDLQEFLLRGYEPGSGNIRQSITEVEEEGERESLQHQSAAEFQSQGSGMSSQGLSQLSQVSEGGKSSVAELNTSVNSNSNNNNNANCASVFDSSGGSGVVVSGVRGRSESLVSMEEALQEFDIGVLSGTHFAGDMRPQVVACGNDSAAPTSSAGMSLSSSSLSQPSHLLLPTITSHSSTQQLASSEDTSRNLSVQHQRQHSRSFNSGLNRLIVPEDARLRSNTLSLAKSVSSDTLNKKGSASDAKGRKKKGGKDKVGSKKKRHTGSTEALSHRDGSQKPPLGRPRRNKLVLEPRGPLYGLDGGGVELRRHSALLVETHSSQLSQMTHVDRQGTPEAPEEEGGEGEEEEEGRRRVLSLESTVTMDDESLSLADFLRGQSPPPGSGEDSVWLEYGQL